MDPVKLINGPLDGMTVESEGGIAIEILRQIHLFGPTWICRYRRTSLITAEFESERQIIL